VGQFQLACGRAGTSHDFSFTTRKLSERHFWGKRDNFLGTRTSKQHNMMTTSASEVLDNFPNFPLATAGMTISQGGEECTTWKSWGLEWRPLTLQHLIKIQGKPSSGPDGLSGSWGNFGGQEGPEKAEGNKLLPWRKYRDSGGPRWGLWAVKRRRLPL